MFTAKRRELTCDMTRAVKSASAQVDTLKYGDIVFLYQASAPAPAVAGCAHTVVDIAT